MDQVFKVLLKDKNSLARVGRIKTLHGIIETPAFIPDATLGAVKHLASAELRKIGLQIVLANIYHLSLRPGISLIKKFGGLHSFMDWSGPLITDSGGFQVFSLVYKKHMGKVLESGVEFKDPLTGDQHFLTPKKSIAAQLNVGADILMVLDYPVLGQALKKDNDISVKLTTKWAYQSWLAFLKNKQSKGRILMAIIQGADSRLMRKKSFLSLESIQPFLGYGFGGPPLNMEILKSTALLIPQDRIRYVMGGGTPQDILTAVSFGWDLFDCVIPTRNARHGLLYSFAGEVKIAQAQYALDQKPIEADCPCLACQNYSRSYLRHLFKVSEPLALRLFSLHNLTFYMRLMKKIRQRIRQGKFSSCLDDYNS